MIYILNLILIGFLATPACHLIFIHTQYRSVVIHYPHGYGDCVKTRNCQSEQIVTLSAVPAAGRESKCDNLSLKVTEKLLFTQSLYAFISYVSIHPDKS